MRPVECPQTVRQNRLRLRGCSQQWTLHRNSMRPLTAGASAVVPEDAAARRVRRDVVAAVPVLPQSLPHVPRVLGIVFAQDGLDRLCGLLLNIIVPLKTLHGFQALQKPAICQEGGLAAAACTDQIDSGILIACAWVPRAALAFQCARQ